MNHFIETEAEFISIAIENEHLKKENETYK